MEIMEKKLNKNQLKAVQAQPGPVMVIAGPGSGKTFVITQRVHHMIEQFKLKDYQILVITFTKAAAEEMKSRYVNTYGHNRVTFGTFHSIFYKILRLMDPKRYDLEHLISEDKKKKIIETLYKELEHEDYEDFVELFLAHLTLVKNELINPRHYNPQGLPKDVFLALYQKYDQYKERNCLFDFDDMLVDCYYALENNEQLLEHMQNKYKHILIDEFQDINAVQFKIIKQLASKHKDLFVVGDDDQSIYQFRGSKPEFLLSFEDYFSPVQKIILDENYRSTEAILTYSNALINHNKVRYEKIMKTALKSEQRPQMISCEDVKAQAKHIVETITKLTNNGTPLNECAIIYRTNIQARPLVEALMTAHLPFVLKDNLLTLYDQWITKDILNYLQLAKDMHQNEKIAQIINKPSRYISKVALADAINKPGNLLENLLTSSLLHQRQKDSIQELIYHLQCLKKKDLSKSISYIRHTIGYENYLKDYANYRQTPFSNLQEIMLEIQESASGFSDVETWEEQLKLMAHGIKTNNNKQGGIILTTMHSAKGLEFENVFIVDVIDGVIPHHKSLGEQGIEEERRLLYVAMTRAKQQLFMYIPQKRHQEKTIKSPFIDECFYLPLKIKKDMMITHKYYGKGKVLEVEGTKARVAFKDGTNRVFDYEVCLKQKLIFRED